MDIFDELRVHGAYSALTTEGRDLVEGVFRRPPVRTVGKTSLRSVSGSYASRKFRFLTDYESAGCEKPYILLASQDTSIVELFAQPASLDVIRRDRKGRKRPQRYVPDFLEFSTNRISLIEAKTRKDLEELALRSRDWLLDASGCWHFTPAEDVAQRCGFGFRIFCPDDHSRIYLANLQVIDRLPSCVLDASSTGLIRRIRAKVGIRPRTVLGLCNEFPGLTGGLLYAAISRGELFGLLDLQLLDRDFLVYACEEDAKRHIGQAGNASSRPGEQGPLARRLASASPRELDLTIAAKQRFDRRRAAGDPFNATDYRDRGRLREAAVEGAPPFAAFLRRVKDRGGSGPRIPAATAEAIGMRAHEYLSSGGIPKLSLLYADFAVYAEDKGLYCPSRETYRKYYGRQLAPERAAFLSGGKRAFHAARPRTDGALANPKPAVAGLRVHIDGVYGDVRSAPDEDDVFLRPVFYPMVDDATGYVLARGIKVGHPNAMVVAIAFRDCYLRHACLPAQIVSDWGSEFVNKFVDEMCAAFSVGRERRPAGAPRFGGMSEMLNAQLSSFLQCMTGGAYFDKASRSVDGCKKSRSTARHTLTEIIAEADRWLFDVWNRTPIGSNTKSPEELWNDSMRCFPEATVRVQEGPIARYFTSYPINARKFDYVSGLSYAGQRYTSALIPELLQRGDRPVAPRLDSMDPSIIHVRTRNGPLELYSMQYQRTRGLAPSQKMVELGDLFSARSRADANQHRRNMAQVRRIAEMRKVLPSHSANRDQSPSAGIDEGIQSEAARAPEKIARQKPKFSNCASTQTVPLARLPPVTTGGKFRV